MEAEQEIEIGKRDDGSDRPRHGKLVYVPTPEEIAAACAEIRSRWTAEERYLRLRGWGKKSN